MCSRETTERWRVCVRGREREKDGECVSVCACEHEAEIHYSDNESIWDSMRQFTSPVVVSSIPGEDTLPARSQRTSMWRRGLVSMPADRHRQRAEFHSGATSSLSLQKFLSCCVCPQYTKMALLSSAKQEVTNAKTCIGNLTNFDCSLWNL